MKTIKIYIINICLLFCLSINVHTQEIPDSILTKEYVYELTFTSPQKAKKILDIIREKEKMPEFLINIIEGDLYFNNSRYRQALSYYNKAWKSDSVQMNNSYYMEQLHRIITCYGFLNNMAQKKAYVELLMAKADSCDNDIMLSIAQFNTGKILYYQGNKDKAYHYINNAIELMKKTDYKTKYDHLRYNYNTLLIFQKKDDLYEDALKTLDSLQTIIRKTDKVPHIAGYLEVEKKNFYAHKAVILSSLGEANKAKRYYERWLTLNKENDKAETLIMPYLFNNKMYDDIIEINLKKEKFIRQHQDSISYAMLEIKKQLAEAYKLKGRYQKAVEYFDQLATITDSIKTREQKGVVLEYAAIYETQKKDLQIQEQEALAQKREVYLTSTIFIVILLTIVLFILYYNMIEIRKKNKAMVKNIKELQQLRKEHLLSIKKNEKKTSNMPIVKSTTDILFEKFLTLINEEKIYLNPSLTRDDVVARLNTNKNIFVETLKKNTGLTFSEYINELRLDDSLLLLENINEDENIETIAEQVGFSKSSFYRLFKERFGMTPTEYKNQFNK